MRVGEETNTSTPLVYLSKRGKKKKGEKGKKNVESVENRRTNLSIISKRREKEGEEVRRRAGGKRTLSDL